MQGKLGELTLLKTFSARLDEIERDRLSEYEAQGYKGAFEEVEFQNDLVAKAFDFSRRTGCCVVESPPGSGKTIIEAKLAEKFLPGGKVLVIGKSRTAMGHVLSGGIIAKFSSYFKHIGKDVDIGNLNDADLANDILFFTPICFNNLRVKYGATFREIVKACGSILVDEVHRFPDDRNEELKIYDKVYRVAERYFIGEKKPAIGLSATCFRMDGKFPFGKAEPDFQVTVQELVDQGWCPEIRGIQAFIDAEISSVDTVGDFYAPRMTDTAAEKYWKAIAERMVEVWRRYPLPTCAFVRAIKDAARLVNVFNTLSGLGERGLAVMIGETPESDRQEIVASIKAGKLLGYVTCEVGEESLDLPPLTIVHLIRRTKSDGRNMQAVGRALRTLRDDDEAAWMFAKWGGKKFALVVDYHLMSKKIIEGCKGLLEFAQCAGSRRPLSCGRIVVRKERAPVDAKSVCVSMGQELAWIRKLLDMDDATQLKIAVALEMCKRGLPRPRFSDGGMVAYALNDDNEITDIKVGDEARDVLKA